MEIYLGKNIKFLRGKKEMTQRALGDVFEVENTTVGGWEKGESFPQFKILVSMRQFFEVNLESLVFSDLSANSVPSVQEKSEQYVSDKYDSELRQLLQQVSLLTEQVERMRGDVGKMGVMEARLHLLERQLELVLGELGRKKG